MRHRKVDAYAAAACTSKAVASTTSVAIDLAPAHEGSGGKATQKAAIEPKMRLPASDSHTLRRRTFAKRSSSAPRRVTSDAAMAEDCSDNSSSASAGPFSLAAPAAGVPPPPAVSLGVTGDGAIAPPAFAALIDASRAASAIFRDTADYALENGAIPFAKGAFD